MVAARPTPYVTADEFLRRPEFSGPGELVRGEVRMMTPAGGVHGIVAGVIHTVLSSFVDANGLGFCFAGNTGFLFPGLGDTVRSPDAAFVRNERLPSEGVGPGWMPVAPDLSTAAMSFPDSRCRWPSSSRVWLDSQTRVRAYAVDAFSVTTRTTLSTT